MAKSNTTIIMKDYWNKRYEEGRTSGTGSYGKEMERKVLLVRDLVKACYPPIKTVLDFGCGDFNFGKEFMKYVNVQYTGYDFSKTIIERNKGLYETDSIKFTNKLPKSKADIVICMDVLFHIIDEKEYQKTLKTLGKSYSQYLIVSTIGNHEVRNDWAFHVKPRKLTAEKRGDVCVLGKLIAIDKIIIEGEPTTKLIYFFEKP